MPERVLMKGNEAVGEAAIQAGCRYFFGYPITPQNEVPEYMARRLPEVGGVYLQAESEVAAINMVYGAAGAGVRVMTSSSSPGISLMQEGISYICGAELPCVIVNMVRGGPGLGSIQPAQSDYFQATKGGGHGDYRLIVLAPASLQEIFDLMGLAFPLAEKYRNPVMILGDGVLGQMMEPVVLPDEPAQAPPPPPWATTGCQGRRPNVINSLYIEADACEAHNRRLQAKYDEIARKEVRYEALNTSDAEVVLVAYGSVARVCHSAMELARAEGIKVGLFRPITLWPFPSQALAQIAAGTGAAGVAGASGTAGAPGRGDSPGPAFLTVEMSAGGQMVEDVRLAVNGLRPVHFYGRSGGVVPTPHEVLEQIRALRKAVAA